MTDETQQQLTMTLREFRDLVAREVKKTATAAIIIFAHEREVRGGFSMMNQASRIAAELAPEVAERLTHDILKCGLASKIGAHSRSSRAGKASRQRVDRKGAKPAEWRVHAEKLFARRKYLKKTDRQSLLTALIENCVIDDAGDGEYVCHATGYPIVKTVKNMLTEIGRIKTKVIETRTSSGK